MDASVISQVRHLYEVERLSQRQVAKTMGISRKRVSKIIRVERIVKPPQESIMKPYMRLVDEWYKEYPFLKATQVYGRLKSYGFKGSYPTVSIYTQRYRRKKVRAYHELEFLPGEEAQIDWMQWKIPEAIVYGFVFVLAYSRYLFVRFYPRCSLEFFLDGHIEAYKEIKGVAHRNRYDNLRSVVIKRRPDLKFNPQFLDFACHYGFSIHACNPQRANEKGRVERVIRDIKDFLRVNTFIDLSDLNNKTTIWRSERNRRIHRGTGKRPFEALLEEKLNPLPQIQYKPYRVVTAQISTTGFVEFDTNRYSAPTQYSGMSCEILSYPENIEIVVKGRKVAIHRRTFERKKKIENPSHREGLLNVTPNFKYQRIYQLMKGMDRQINHFLLSVEDEGGDPVEVAYELFKLLKNASKEMLISAIREANSIKAHRIKYIKSLLQPFEQKDRPVHPQDRRILEIIYEGRDLREYDELI